MVRQVVRCASVDNVCGDHTAEGIEECDGPDLKGQTCASLGFAGGALDCEDVCVFNTSGCSG